MGTPPQWPDPPQQEPTPQNPHPNPPQPAIRRMWEDFKLGLRTLFGPKECAMCEGVGEYRIGVYSYWCRFCNGGGIRKWWH